MSLLSRMMRWIVCGLVVSLIFALGSPARGVAQGIVSSTKMPTIAPELINFPQVSFNQFPAIPCTQQLKYQFNQQAKISLNCQIGSLVPADKLLLVGNFANFGLTQTSLQSIANVNNLNLNQIGADQLQKFYGLINPNKLLSDRFGDIYQTQILDKMPLVQDALIQNITDQYNLGNLQPLQQLNTLLLNTSGLSLGGNTIDVLKSPDFLGALGQLNLSKVVAAIPEFGDFSFNKLSTQLLKSYSIADAIPDLVRNPIGSLAEVESLSLSDLKAVGVPNLSISQLPRPVTLAGGVRFGRFDIPFSNDEKDLGRQISGGITSSDGALQKQNCSGTCNSAELSSPIDATYNGATWIDGENWVPDGFGLVCSFWPGGCKGPAGNNPFGSNVRVLLTNINASAGTAQVSITFPLCYDVWFVGRTCTPSVFPIPSGIPLYTIHEGNWLPFVVPRNYGSS
jgi:hypothetical protein